jgi:HK97 family phage prohead protease
MSYEVKAVPLLEFKVDAEGPGRFEGLASTYHVDLGNDRVEPGAFAASIPRFLERGGLHWGHALDQPPVGLVEQAVEERAGLRVGGVFHATARGQEARQVAAERVRAGRPLGLSIGYDARASRWESAKDGSGERVRVLTAVELYEVSLTPIPMNPHATLTAVKTHAVAAPAADRRRTAAAGAPIFNKFALRAAIEAQLAAVARNDPQAELRWLRDSFYAKYAR